MKTALLLSGGLDSAAIAWWKKPEYCIFINYGQSPFEGERRAAVSIAESIQSEFIELSIDCSSIGSGSLINSAPLDIAPSKEWWPFRNQMLITLAAPMALKLNVSKILFGSVKTDSFHKDGTNEFFTALNLIMVLQEGAIEIEAPAVNLRAEDLIKTSKIPVNLVKLTHSCHEHNFACGTCEGCIKHYAILKLLEIEF